MESATPLDTLANGLLGLGHPLRIRALVLLEAEQSPRDLAETLDCRLGLMSYHVRALRDYGLIEMTRTEPRRGAVQHFYQRTGLADELLGKLNGVLEIPPRKAGRPGPARREQLTTWAQTAA